MPQILVVDDAEPLRELARLLLESLGMGVTVANNGLFALEMCRYDMPDVILLDWNMPLMNGPTFQKELKKLPGGTKPKIIFCTIESDMSHMERAIDGGALEYIMKPYNRDILISKLEMAGVIEISDAA